MTGDRRKVGDASGDPGEGLLSRWSRRKAQVRHGSAPAADPLPLAESAAGPSAAAPAATPATSAVEATQPALPPPTLEDVAALGLDADYARFVAPGVDEGVKRAAMRKLFSDPRFNVMDGLDTYIDDYGKPDPIPASMLRRMVQSHALGLFDDEKDPAQAIPDGATAPSLPPSPSNDALAAPAPIDEDPALRLQQDDAADAAGARADRTGPGA
jgi:hypothetical protein